MLTRELYNPTSAIVSSTRRLPQTAKTFCFATRVHTRTSSSTLKAIMNIVYERKRLTRKKGYPAEAILNRKSDIELGFARACIFGQQQSRSSVLRLQK